ncbi:MAG TPA: hypothetical protein VFH63_06360, partial [candidate division Zixibacteria bacterium]|nr:hypothetical protein [candidate division Zixibacteria bacterium]
EATATAAPSEAEPAPGTALNACELVSADDVAAMLLALSGEEVTVAAGELTEEPTVLDPNKTDCRYADEWGGLVVSLTPTDGANLYDAARGSYTDAKDLEIAGADSAFWSADTNRGFFWKGSVTVMLQLTHTAAGGIDWEEATAMLGQAAIDKL